jgi:outer membrane protein assembly factor BamB
MGGVKQLSILALLGAGLVSCRSERVEPWRLPHNARDTWSAEELGLVLTQPKIGQIAAYDVKSGKPLWRFERAEARHEVIVFPARELICTPLKTRAAQIVLSYSDAMLVLSAAKGELLWQRELEQGAPVGAHLCPTATPDSAIVVTAERGTALLKLDANGGIVWSFALPKGAPALGAPSAVVSSGDVLVRSGREILSINPRGTLNWAMPVSALL